MIAPTPVSNVSRVAANQTSSGSASRDSGTRTSITSNSSASGETSEVLVAMEATKRQAVSGNGGSGQGQGEGSGSDSGTGSGSSAAPSEQNSAAVDTAIRTDSAGLEAAQSAINNDSAGLEAAKAAVENNLTQLASDPDKFHEVLNKSFGGNYNKAEAEQIRQQVLEGDFSWMPKIEVVSQSVLQDRSNTQGSGTALGAYSKDTDTIYISRELLASDPDKAAQILLEETGHALDARLNTSDAAGDEGDIFARLTTGESISDSELAELKAENDSGTILIDGKEVEVEYGFLSKAFKAVTKPFRKVGKAISKGFKAIKKGVSKVWSGIKKGFKKLMNSKLFNAILTVAQFIPIPVVQVAVRVINVVKAAYSVYQGVKHGSVAAVLGGVAGVAGGVGGLGARFGASAGFVNGANRIASGARALGAGYSALAKGDFAAAGSLASNWFGGSGTQAGRFFSRAGQVAATVDSARRGDIAGVASNGLGAFRSFQGGDNAGSQGAGSGRAQNSQRSGGFGSGVRNFINDIKNSGTVRAITDNVSTIRGIVKSVRSGNYSEAASSFLGQYGNGLGIDTSTSNSIQRWAGVVERVDSTRNAFRSGNYSQAIGQAAGLLGMPLNDVNQGRLNSAFELRDAVADDRFPEAARLAAGLAESYGKPELANTFMSIFTALGGSQEANRAA